MLLMYLLILQIAYSCGCGVLVKIEVPLVDHVGFKEVDYKLKQLGEDLKFFSFLNYLRCIEVCPLT